MLPEWVSAPRLIAEYVLGESCPCFGGAQAGGLGLLHAPRFFYGPVDIICHPPVSFAARAVPDTPRYFLRATFSMAG
jgi:hypothetical protein